MILPNLGPQAYWLLRRRRTHRSAEMSGLGVLVFGVFLPLVILGLAWALGWLLAKYTIG